MALHDLDFNIKQTKALTTEANAICFGGAKGGGKSFLLRHLAVLYCLYIPHIQVFLFRKKYKDLRNNHLWSQDGLVNILKDYMVPYGININYSDMRINFANGAQIHLSHMNNDVDMFNYQGKQLPLVA